MSGDLSYYVARAGEERLLAIASANSNVRRIHLEMAARYAALAGMGGAYAGDEPSEPEQLTALIGFGA